MGGACALLLGGAIAALALAVAGPPVLQPAAVPATGAALAVQAPAAAAFLATSVPAAPGPAATAPTEAPMSVSDDGTLAMAVDFVPAQVRVGSALVMRLTIQNRSSAPVPRVQIDASGPWASYAVTDVTPAGAFERVSDTQGTIRSEAALAPNSTATVSVLAIANQAGNAQFTFALRPPDQ